MNVRLLVIRTSDPRTLSDFYAQLGLVFEYHSHGNSPLHYSTTVDKTVLEIYPLTKSQVEPDKNLRIGFGIENFDNTISRLKNSAVPFSMEPTDTEFGFMAIVTDPDGRKIELYKND